MNLHGITVAALTILVPLCLLIRKRSRRRSVAISLSLALLTACAASPSGENATPRPTETEKPVDMVYLTIGKEKDTELLSVDGQPITAEDYLFWLTNTILIQKQQGNLSDDSAWEESLNGSDTFSALKSSALNSALFYRVIRTKAEAAEITLGEKEKAEVDDRIAADIEQAGGEAAFQNWLHAHCISMEAYRRIYETYSLEQKLRDSIEEVDTFVEEQGILAYKQILLLTRRMAGNGVELSYEEYTDEERAEVRDRLIEMRKKILSSKHVEAEFDALMDQHSEDERDEKRKLLHPEGYTYLYPGQMDEALEAEVKALQIGEVSEPIQMEYGYCLLLRIAPNAERARIDIQEKRTKEWTSQAEIIPTTAYEELDPKDFYDRLIEKVKAADDPEPTPKS